MVQKGKFIVLEGLDGSGSTTQLQLLNQWFIHNRQIYGSHWSTFEPTDGPIGSLIRLTLKKRLPAFDEATMALLFAADRCDHLFRDPSGGKEEGIASKLNSGIHVLCDRYVLSSLAYQARAMGLEWVSQINNQAICPDLTIFIDTDASVAGERMINNRTHTDLYEDLHEQRQIQKKYHEAIDFLKSQGQNIVTVNGQQDQGKVHEDIVKEVAALFNSAK